MALARLLANIVMAGTTSANADNPVARAAHGGLNTPEKETEAATEEESKPVPAKSAT
jgi:hypothetical protein